MEKDLHSARAAIAGSFAVLAIAAGFLFLTGQPVRSSDSTGTPVADAGTASPIASPVTAGTDVQVSIRRLTFRPFRVTIPAGGSVMWTNFDGVPHTVTARGDFDSGRIDQNGRFVQTFTDPGEVWYECLYHKDMVAVVEVIAPEE